MYQIQNMTASPKQKQTLILPDGDQITLVVRFVPLQLGWFISELTYQEFTLRGVRVCNSPNLIYQYKNQVPFGLACFSSHQREPQLRDDFLTEASKLYILTPAEVQAYTEYLTGGQV